MRCACADRTRGAHSRAVFLLAVCITRILRIGGLGRVEDGAAAPTARAARARDRLDLCDGRAARLRQGLVAVPPLSCGRAPAKPATPPTTPTAAPAVITRPTSGESTALPSASVSAAASSSPPSAGSALRGPVGRGRRADTSDFASLPSFVSAWRAAEAVCAALAAAVAAASASARASPPRCRSPRPSRPPCRAPRAARPRRRPRSPRRARWSCSRSAARASTATRRGPAPRSPRRRRRRPCRRRPPRSASPTSSSP